MHYTLRVIPLLAASVAAACTEPGGPAGADDLQANTRKGVTTYTVVQAAKPATRTSYSFIIPSGAERNPFYAFVHIVHTGGDSEPRTTKAFPMNLEAQNANGQSCEKAEGRTSGGDTLRIARSCDKAVTDAWEVEALVLSAGSSLKRFIVGPSQRRRLILPTHRGPA